MDEEKRKVYEVITDCWKCIKEYGFQPMSDADWEKLIDNQSKIDRKWMLEQDRKIYKDIYRSLMSSLLSAVEVIQKEYKEDSNG